MALSAILTKEEFEKLNDDLKAHYKEADDNYKLDVVPVDGNELVGPGLKTALENERNEVKKLKSSLSAYKGLDPEEAKKALATISNLDKLGEDEKVKAIVDAQLADQAKLHKESLEKTQSQLDRYQNFIKTNVLEKTAEAAITSEGGNATLLKPIVTRFLQVEETDNDFKVKVINENGIQRVGGSDGEPMTVNQLVASLKNDPNYAVAFLKNKSGTGAGQNSESSGVSVVSKDQASDRLADIAAGKVKVT